MNYRQKLLRLLRLMQNEDSLRRVYQLAERLYVKEGQLWTI